MDSKDLAQKVLLRRTELGLSQQALADRAGISRNYVSQIERDEAQNISTTILEQLATALQLTVSGLIDYVPQQQNMQIPPALWELALDKGLSAGAIDKLMRIPRRGKEPTTKEEWLEIYNVIQKYIGQ